MLLTFSGALNLDIIVEIESLESVSAAVGMKLMPGREYIISHEILNQLQGMVKTQAKIRYVGGGGSSANTCTALARIGHRTSFVGVCGKDELGDLVLSSMNHVDLKYVKRDNKTACCIIFLTKDYKDRTILVAPGAQTFTMDDPGTMEFLHITSLPSREGLKTHENMVKGLGRDTVLTMDPGEIYSRMGKETLWPMLTRTSILFLTAVEYEMLFGSTPCKDVLETMYDQKTGHSPAFSRALVIKKGKDGAMCILDQGQYEVVAGNVPDIVDNTGAGDSFNAGFIHAWLKGCGPEKCLESGARLAALSLGDWGRNWLGRLNSDDQIWVVDHRKR